MQKVVNYNNFQIIQLRCCFKRAWIFNSCWKYTS